jgi:hypothetical protein
MTSGLHRPDILYFSSSFQCSCTEALVGSVSLNWLFPLSTSGLSQKSTSRWGQLTNLFKTVDVPNINYTSSLVYFLLGTIYHLAVHILLFYLVYSLLFSIDYKFYTYRDFNFCSQLYNSGWHLLPLVFLNEWIWK